MEVFLARVHERVCLFYLPLLALADVCPLGVPAPPVETNERVLVAFVDITTRQTVRRQLETLVANTPGVCRLEFVLRNFWSLL